MDRERLIELRDFHREGLLEDTVQFWAGHAPDREFGGFLTCLERDGRVYSTDKAVWLQGRAAWLFGTLYARVEARPEWLELARHGCDFLTKHCFDGQGKMYFAVTREGHSLRMRRYVFSEVFAVLAFAALAEAVGEEPPKRRAIELFDTVLRYSRTPGLIEPKVDPRTRPMKSLSPLMCVLGLADAMLRIDDDARYERIIDETVAELFEDFVRADDGVLLETVGPAGERIDTPDGRVVNPGHSIEVAWFVLEVARRRGDRGLVDRAARILDGAYARGWDREYGGLLYFVDVEGKPPANLEHDMKLWWPHGEALYAALLAYHLTGETKYAEMYERVHEWTYDHFPDPEYGEWFGYLHRDGSLSTDLKGSMWKGPFHVPRAQLLCWKLLEEMVGS